MVNYQNKKTTCKLMMQKSLRSLQLVGARIFDVFLVNANTLAFTLLQVANKLLLKSTKTLYYFIQHIPYNNTKQTSKSVSKLSNFSKKKLQKFLYRFASHTHLALSAAGRKTL